MKPELYIPIHTIVYTISHINDIKTILQQLIDFKDIYSNHAINELYITGNNNDINNINKLVMSKHNSINNEMSVHYLDNTLYHPYYKKTNPPYNLLLKAYFPCYME